MSKELEALKQVKNFLGYNYCSVDLPNELRTIKIALQRLESIDNTTPSEALERFTWIRDQFYFNINDKMTYSGLEENSKIIEQALIKAQEQEKVLSIIKEKNVDIFFIKACKTIEQYNLEICKNSAFCYGLTQEEFDLLKRWANGNNSSNSTNL